jgi:hypothetical protein
MNESDNIYRKQYKNAHRTYEKLKLIQSEIDFKLKTNPVCSHLHKDLREVNLNIKITLNEIEHIESHLLENEAYKTQQ